jgi:hypothetical protein
VDAPFHHLQKIDLEYPSAAFALWDSDAALLTTTYSPLVQSSPLRLHDHLAVLPTTAANASVKLTVKRIAYSGK